MIQLCMTLGGFGLLFLGDINSVTWKKPFLKLCFFPGVALIAAAALSDIAAAFYLDAIRGWDYALLGLGLVSVAALCYCLFFAIPFHESYLAPQAERKTYRGGIYGLCRHGGVWCFAMAQLCFGAAALPTPMLWRGLFATALNIAYSWFQDVCVFPEVFTDHADYRRCVPFLIPKRESLRRLLRSGEKEE